MHRHESAEFHRLRCLRLVNLQLLRDSHMFIEPRTITCITSHSAGLWLFLLEAGSSVARFISRIRSRNEWTSARGFAGRRASERASAMQWGNGSTLPCLGRVGVDVNVN